MKKFEIQTKANAVAQSLWEWYDPTKHENHPFSELDIDSIDIIEFIIEIEKEFKVIIQDEEVERMRQMSDVINYLEEHFNQ